jgi:hypothetical protein
MQRPAPSPDRSSAIAFIVFASAAAVWIGVMAAQPKPAGLQASVIVMTKDIALLQPQPHWIELAGMAR